MAIKVGGTTVVDDSRNITGISISGLTTPLSLAQGGTAGTTAGTARTALGLVIGTDVLAPNGSAASLTSFPTLNQNTSGSAASLSATLAVASGGTGVTTSTGTTNVVLSNSPTLVSPALGTPSSGNLANCTFPTLNQNTSGSAASLSATLAVASGGTNSTATPTAGGAAYGTGTAFAFNSAGSVGQLLTSQGASAPTWTTPSAGALVFISSQTITTGVASVDFTSGIDSTYDNYQVLFENLSQDTAAATLRFRLRQNGAFTDEYTRANMGVKTGGTYSGTVSTNENNISDTRPEESTTATKWKGHFYIMAANSTSARVPALMGTIAAIGNTTGGTALLFIAGSPNTGAVVTGFSVFFNLGNMTSGTFRLYGIIKS